MDVQNVENLTGRLARMIYALCLQNNIYRWNAMQKVMALALNLENIPVGKININVIPDVMHGIQKFDALLNKKTKDIDNTLRFLNMYCLQNEISFESVIRQIFLYYNISNVYVDKIVKENEKFIFGVKFIINALNLINSSVSVQTFDTVSQFSNIKSDLINYQNGLKQIMQNQNDGDFVTMFESEKSCILIIEQYKKLTNEAYLKSLSESFIDLVSPITLRESFLSSKRRKFIKMQVHGIYIWLSKTQLPNTLLDFSQGKKNIDKFLEDFDDEQLKKMLNQGKSLNELKTILKPVSNLLTKLAATGNNWTYTARKSFANFNRRSLTMLENIDSFNPEYFFSSLKNITQKNVKPISNFDISILNEFKAFLNSSHSFTDFRVHFNELYNLSEMIKNRISQIEVEFSNDQNKTEKLAKCIIEDFAQMKSKFDHLENIRDLLSKKTKQFNVSLTNKLVNQIQKTVSLPCEMKSELFAKKTHVSSLNLSLLTKKDTAEARKLLKTLLATRSKFNLWKKMEKDFTAEMKVTEGIERLFPIKSSCITVSHLVCSLRILNLYQKTDLREIAVKFVSNGQALADKIENLPKSERNEKKIYVSTWDQFSSLNESFAPFLSITKTLPVEFHKEGQSLETFGAALSSSINIIVPQVDFDSMVETLHMLKSTSIGQAKEISDVEKSIEQFSNLRCALNQKRRNLPALLGEADGFFRQFFSKPQPWIQKIPLMQAVVFVVCSIIAGVIGSLISLLRNSLRNVDFWF